MKPCIYTGHYSKYKAPAAVCLPREVSRRRNNRDQLQPEHISIYLLFNNVELASDPQQQLTPNHLKKMAALLNQEEIKQDPWSSVVREFKSDRIL